MEQKRSTRVQPATTPLLTPDELAHWHARACAAPDVRLARVLRIRRAIIAQDYEDDARIDYVVDAISDDLTDSCDVFGFDIN